MPIPIWVVRCTCGGQAFMFNGSKTYVCVECGKREMIDQEPEWEPLLYGYKGGKLGE